ncbi:MAG: hypothetical protein HC869_04330 [Rhodospirillales bacterium]|nr:hypothetical protein [Rhodospirillales bacterium]
MIQYVEQGRMGDIASLFAALNVALGVMDRDEDTGLQRLMSVQDRANSIATLRQAPTVVVQIVEDVLAQTAEAHADMLTNPITRSWQAEVLPLCKAAVEGRAKKYAAMTSCSTVPTPTYRRRRERGGISASLQEARAGTLCL